MKAWWAKVKNGTSLYWHILPDNQSFALCGAWIMGDTFNVGLSPFGPHLKPPGKVCPKCLTHLLPVDEENIPFPLTEALRVTA